VQTRAGLHTNCPEQPKLGYGPGGLSSKDGPAKNLYTKSERFTVSRRVTWVWSGRVNLYRYWYYREIHKHMQRSQPLWAPGDPFRTTGRR